MRVTVIAVILTFAVATGSLVFRTPAYAQTIESSQFNGYYEGTALKSSVGCNRSKPLAYLTVNENKVIWDFDVNLNFNLSKDGSFGTTFPAIDTLSSPHYIYGSIRNKTLRVSESMGACKADFLMKKMAQLFNIQISENPTDDRYDGIYTGSAQVVNIKNQEIHCSSDVENKTIAIRHGVLKWHWFSGPSSIFFDVAVARNGTFSSRMGSWSIDGRIVDRHITAREGNDNGICIGLWNVALDKNR